MKQVSKAKLGQYIQECRQHVYRIEYALKNTELFFPLEMSGFKTLSDQQIEHVDQLIFRFSKLQDVMGSKLFPTILTILGEDVVTKPFADRLNRLEQLNIIPDADDWMYQRELRNQVAHEYPEEEKFLIEALNALRKSAFKIIETFHGIERYLQTKNIFT